MPASFLPSRSPAAGSTLALAEPPPPLFSSTRRTESGGSIRLILAGELDLAARPQLITALDGAQDDSDRVVLDLAALVLIDCACLFVVFVAGDRSARERAVLILFNPRDQVRRMFDLVGTPAGVMILDSGDLPHRDSAGVAA
jgi:anti-anti-sigma factor